MHFAAGLTELETEVHPVLGMQGWVGAGAAPGPCVHVSMCHGLSGNTSACSVLASLPKLSASGAGVVPGEPRSSMLGAKAM